MKTKEFIRRVEGLEFEVKNGKEYYVIKDIDGEVIASINKLITFQICTDFNAWDELCDDLKKQLFDIISKYASTPADEREEEKKFYLRHIWLKPNLTYKNYLNHWIGTSHYWLDYKNEAAEVKTQFTEKEIEEIKEKFNTDLKDFELVEVNNDCKNFFKER